MNYLDSLTRDTDGNYLITTVDDLLGLSDCINGGNDCAGLTFKLANDLDLADIAFIAIGNLRYQFYGTFDGDNHTISNLKIRSDVEAVGLFGYVGTGGEIRNLIPENVKIDVNNRIGSVAGENKGKITNCTVKTCDLKGRWAVGGIVGDNSGKIKNCKVVCSHINRSRHKIGGLVGHNESKISDCYAVIKNISSESPKKFGAIIGLKVKVALSKIAITTSMAQISLKK